jgi:hypothetical protein
MTSIELTAIQTLRQKGYAVAVWEPSEIGLADPRALEDQATSLFPYGAPHQPSPMEIELAGDGIANWVHLIYACTLLFGTVPITFRW